ncbi:CPBP family intramembrane glutamic endopeptidase [Sciscionella marina]|uniref:CPBP family intramembrane glutamic endopeptidase n=1 Tax=Sciscionella marina TaxID=508770 RepID=UPI000369E64B|nr:type II CAAX endopeptidase family protein [Sciscionella marina]
MDGKASARLPYRFHSWAERVRAIARPLPEHRWGLGAFLIVLAIYILSAVVISAALAPRNRPASATVALIATIAPTLLAAATALGFAARRGNGPRIDFALRLRPGELRTGLRYGGLGILVTVAAVLVWQQIVGENATSAVGVLVVKGDFSVPQAVVLFLYTFLLGPVCEEIIFRGLCWGALARWGPITACVLSTAIFAASHLEPARTLLLLAIGVPIGLARLVTGSTGASMVAHQVSNFLPALALLLLSTRVLSA